MYAVFAAFSLTACSGGPPAGGQALSLQAPPQPKAHAAAGVPWIPGFVNDMSEEAEVGQLLVPSVPGRKQALALIDKYHVGGFVYFADDTRTPQDTAKLSNALQDESDLPLLLGIGDDQTATYLTPLPSDEAVAAAQRPDDAKAIARVAGTESHAVGITRDYGPVTGTEDLHLASRKKQRAEGVVKAIKDGADQLIDPPDVGRAYNDLLKAVHKGTLSQGRLDEAVGRVLRLKQARGLFGDTRTNPGQADKLVGSDTARSVARSVAAHALTVLKNDDHVLPLHDDKIFVSGASSDKLTKALRAAGLHVAGSARKADVVLLATEDEGKDTATKVRNTARHMPVDLAHAGHAGVCIAAYSSDAATLEAVAKLLSGNLHPSGKLPEAISDAYPAGFGLTL
jgi:beta-N-acetylhexosaminidase